MKSYIFKRKNKLIILAQLLLVFLPHYSVIGQTTGFERLWSNLIPTYFKTQYAGNMGFISFGTGWEYGRKARGETDIFIGIVPKFDSRDMKITTTVKQNFIPWNIRIQNTRYSIDPLSCGAYANFIYGDDFWMVNPDKYPKSYYGVSSMFRLNAFIGQRIKKEAKHLDITIFYEISITDIMIVNAIENSNLYPRDYLSLSFGLKLQKHRPE